MTVTVKDRLSVPARDPEVMEPCLYCGVHDYLQPARPGGHRVACYECAQVERPDAMGATRERKLDDIDLDARGVNDIKRYRSRQS